MINQGKLQEYKMPVLPDSIFWHTLLSSSPASSNAENASADNTSAHCQMQKYAFRIKSNGGVMGKTGEQ
jgi:hypothetical protein